MQRSLTVVAALILLAAAGYVIFNSRAPTVVEPTAPTAAAETSVVAPPSASAPDMAPDAAAHEDVKVPLGPELKEYAAILEGGPVPPLPSTAPKRAGFGVALFGYRGAQFAAKGAPAKRDALARASALVDAARADFGKVVEQADRGSLADAGSLPRGVLEPHLEYVLFTMDKGSVFPVPLDTPRGYWILKRLK